MHCGTEEADASSKAIQPDPRESGKSHSRWWFTDIGNVAMKSGGVILPLDVPFSVRSACYTRLRLVKVVE